MIYTRSFFSVLLWICLAGLIIDFGFQLWYTIVDFKTRNRRGENC